MPPDNIKSSNEEGVYFYNGCVPGKGYSVGYSLLDLVKQGNPQSISELFALIINSTKEIGKEFTGPVAFNDLDLVSGKLLRDDENSSTLLTTVDSFIRSMNEDALKVCFTLDLIPPDDMLDEFSEYQAEINQFNTILSESLKGSYEKGLFKPTLMINLHNEDIWGHSVFDNYLSLAYLYGSPVIQNRVTSTITHESTTPVDRVKDSEILYQRIGGPSGNAANTGVIGYVCLNLAKMGKDAESEEDFFHIIDKQMDEASEILEEHRSGLVSSVSSNTHPWASKIDDLDWMYSSIVVTGMNECLEYLIDAPLGHVAGKAVTYKVLEFIRIKIEEIQAKTNSLYTLESIPSESINDVLLESSGLPNKYLTRGTELPAYHGNDLWDALEHQKKLQSLYTGATMVEIHVKNGLTYHAGCKLLTQRIVNQFGFNYLAVTPSIIPQSNGVKKVIRVDGDILMLEQLSNNYKDVHGKRVHHDVKNR